MRIRMGWNGIALLALVVAAGGVGAGVVGGGVARAGDDEKEAHKKAEAEAWKKQAREKELRRAREGAEMHGNTERFRKKYGWLQENHPEAFQELIARSEAAGAAWKQVAKQIEDGAAVEDFDAIKEAAYNASEQAWVAEQRVRYLGAITHTEHMAKKSGSAAVAAKAGDLSTKYEQLIELKAREAEIKSQIRALENETRAMQRALEQEAHDARKGKHAADAAKAAKAHDKDREKGKDRAKEKNHDAKKSGKH